VNFDVPLVPEDYIHRVGRTARAEATGDAFTFVAPDEESDLRRIEAAIKKRLSRITVPDFDYNAKPPARLEIPIADRIRDIRARKQQERARAAEKAARRGGAASPASRAQGAGSGRPGGGGSGARGPGARSGSGTRSFGPRRGR